MTTPPFYTQSKEPQPDRKAEETIKQASGELYRSGYRISAAQTEAEIILAFEHILQDAPYMGALLLATQDEFRVGLAIDPREPDGISRLSRSWLIPSTEISNLFNAGPVIGDLALANTLPKPIQQILQQLNIQNFALLPVSKTAKPSTLLILGKWDGKPITQEEIIPYLSITELTATMLESVRAKESMEHRLQELEAIAATSQSISSTTELSELYKILHEHIRQTIGEVGFLVALFDPATNSIQIPYMFERGSNKITSLEPFPLGEGLTSILIRTRQPLMLVEDTEKRAIALGARVVGQPAKSWLGAPLVTGGEPTGAIIIQDTENERAFDESDLRFITTLASQVAGAIHNTRLLQETEFRAIQLQTAAEIARDISGSLELGDLLSKAVNLIRDHLNYYHAAVFLTDHDNEYAIIREATGEAGVQMKRAGHKLAVGSKSIVGFVTSSGEPLVVNDTTRDATYYANPLLPDTRAELAIPLRVGTRILGALDVQSTIGYSFTDESINVLRILADQLAIAVVNSELFAETQEHLAQHRLLHHVTTAAASGTTLDEALSSAVHGLQVTMGGDRVSILLASREKRILEVKSAVGYGDDVSHIKVAFGKGITGWVAEHKQTQRIDDVRKDPRYIRVGSDVVSELAIPLVYRNELLGVLNVESDQSAAYSENDEEMLGTLGGSLAAIIANARLLEQIRRQIDRERLLYEVTSKIRRFTDTESIMEATASELSKALGAQRARIMINPPGSGLASKKVDPRKAGD